jgi:hypothetical protein
MLQKQNKELDISDLVHFDGQRAGLHLFTVLPAIRPLPVPEKW